MKYAIIGSGALGTALARQFVRRNFDVLVANARGRTTIAPLVDELGSNIIPADVGDALKADMVILATPYGAAFDILKAAPAWEGRILVDATNAIEPSDFSPLDLGGRASSDIIAEAAPGARVVKGFNHLWARVLGRASDDSRGHGRRVMFLSGAHESAKSGVAELMGAFGFKPIDLGRTDAGGLLQQYGGPLTSHSLVDQELSGASASEMDLLHV